MPSRPGTVLGKSGNRFRHQRLMNLLVHAPLIAIGVPASKNAFQALENTVFLTSCGSRDALKYRPTFSLFGSGQHSACQSPLPADTPRGRWSKKKMPASRGHFLVALQRPVSGIAGTETHPTGDIKVSQRRRCDPGPLAAGCLPRRSCLLCARDRRLRGCGINAARGFQHHDDHQRHQRQREDGVADVAAFDGQEAR